MIVRKCKTITEAISAALSISLDWGNKNKDPTTDIWYRGVKDNTHNLIPSAYYSGPNVDEYSRFISFKQVVRNLIDTSNFDNWDFYCLARHHGLPTRHLDWTEGLMQALFFAFGIQKLHLVFGCFGRICLIKLVRVKNIFMNQVLI
jgi:hypothetical protein